MTLAYLIRHGDVSWQTMRARGARGRLFNFVELTPAGVAQIEALSGDPRLTTAEAIVTSPYTRALQSAAILSRRLDLPLHVEYDLHEWAYDRDPYAPFDAEETERRRRHFFASDRFTQTPEQPAWETAFDVRTRVEQALSGYLHHRSVLVVCHVGVIFSLTGQRGISPGGVVVHTLS